MKKKKLTLSLNKEVIAQLDKVQLNQIKGGDDDDLTTIFGSNCYNTNPQQHKCCENQPTMMSLCGCATYATFEC